MDKKVQGWNSECLYANLSLGWHCTEESIRGAGAWAAPWTALSISMGIPRHMRAHRCSWAYASIWALVLATCGYEEYGHKWRKAHPHTNTNSTSLSLSSQIHIIRKKTLCFVCSNLGLPTTILSFLLLHIIKGARFFSLEMCSNLWLSGDRFGRLCSPQLFQNNQVPSTIWGRWSILPSSSYKLTVFHKHLCPPNQP